MNRQIASMILAKGKALAPDRFPALAEGPDGRVVLDSWTEALSIVALPVEVWSAAVTMWATSMVGDRMATPRDLIKAAFLVRDRWENDPRRRELLEEARLARLNANYAAMGLAPVEARMLDRGPIQGAGKGARRSSQSGMSTLAELSRIMKRPEQPGEDTPTAQ